MKRILTTAALGLAAAIAAPPAFAQTADGVFAGPYVGLLYGVGRGTAGYSFNTDGWWNDAPGDAFSVPVDGNPMGVTLGYNWQAGNFVYGFETSIQTAILGISHWDTDSPYHPGDQDFDLKGHWFTTLTGRVGYAFDRVMVYAEAGPMLGHLVAEADDTDAGYMVWTPRAVPGIVLGAGVEVAITDALSLAFGYQMMALAPLHVRQEAVDAETGLPAGVYTDHDISYVAHTLSAKLIYRLGGDRAPADRPRTSSEWSGFYAGIFGGALHQVGPQIGYNFRVGERLVASVEAQASLDFCCGLAFEGNLNGRLGFLVNDDILVYGEAGIGYLTGTFYDVLDGFFYTAGGGVEVAITPRLSAFMEVKAVGAPGRGFIDANFQGGYNWHF